MYSSICFLLVVGNESLNFENSNPIFDCNMQLSVNEDNEMSKKITRAYCKLLELPCVDCGIMPCKFMTGHFIFFPEIWCVCVCFWWVSGWVSNELVMSKIKAPSNKYWDSKSNQHVPLKSYSERKHAEGSNSLSVKHKNSSRHSSIEGGFRNYEVSSVYKLCQYRKNVRPFLIHICHLQIDISESEICKQAGDVSLASIFIVQILFISGGNNLQLVRLMCH